LAKTEDSRLRILIFLKITLEIIHLVEIADSRFEIWIFFSKQPWKFENQISLSLFTSFLSKSGSIDPLFENFELK